jgi:hypothetical protein
MAAALDIVLTLVVAVLVVLLRARPRRVLSPTPACIPRRPRP